MYKVGEGKWERETQAACARKTELNLARRALLPLVVPELASTSANHTALGSAALENFPARLGFCEQASTAAVGNLRFGAALWLLSLIHI